MRALSLLVALLAAGASPQAQTGAAADCLGITDDRARLQCYDRVHGRATPSPPVPSDIAPAAPLPQQQPPMPEPTRLQQRWDLGSARGAELFAPRAHKPVYLLPATWTDRLNRRPSSPAPDHTVTEAIDLRAVEAKYQISLKAKFGDAKEFGIPMSLWGGYTQSSRWQVYNGPESRPFRETNYEPELMLVVPLDREVLGWRLRAAQLALNHQSNGRALPLSRSWNRVIGELAFERGDWIVQLRPWWRLPEDASDDDNPDITDHVGRAEVVISRYWGGDHALTLQLRHSLRTGDRSRGSGQLEWVFPMSGTLHGVLQWWSGYGESLIDYNFRQNKIGLGVTIAGWR